MGEILRALSHTPIRLGIPYADTQDLEFTKSTRKGLRSLVVNHGIYTMARSLLLLAAQGRNAEDPGGRILPVAHARATLAANLNRQHALDLNPELCGRMFE